jgi:hypothetical protein
MPPSTCSMKLQVTLNIYSKGTVTEKVKVTKTVNFYWMEEEK